MHHQAKCPTEQPLLQRSGSDAAGHGSDGKGKQSSAGNDGYHGDLLSQTG